MLDEETRTAVLKLRERGHGIRPIARTLRISRQAVRDVIEAGSARPPAVARAEAAEPFRDEILAQYASCKGNLVRVHEELVERGAKFSYAALTAFCRKHGIGYSPPLPDGRYEFAPGQEMQHDTSPHIAKIGDKERRVQSASLVACYSHMLFFQLYPRFTRFECKIFLTDGILYLGGPCVECMIDNTSVIAQYGTGANMVPAPEMAAFAERFHFEFKAHELQDPDRKGRVEAPMAYIEDNFYAGRSFADFEDANRQAVAWCNKVNAMFNRRWHASRRELFRAEQPHLRPLPIWIPPVYELHQRTVDTDGFINLHRNRYSAPYKLIGHRHPRLRVTDGRGGSVERSVEVFSNRLEFEDNVLFPEQLPGFINAAVTEDGVVLTFDDGASTSRRDSIRPSVVWTPYGGRSRTACLCTARTPAQAVTSGATHERCTPGPTANVSRTPMPLSPLLPRGSRARAAGGRLRYRTRRRMTPSTPTAQTSSALVLQTPFRVDSTPLACSRQAVPSQCRMTPDVPTVQASSAVLAHTDTKS